MILTRGLGSWSLITQGVGFLGEIITSVLHEVRKFYTSITNKIRLKVRV